MRSEGIRPLMPVVRCPFRAIIRAESDSIGASHDVQAATPQLAGLCYQIDDRLGVVCLVVVVGITGGES